MNYARSLRCPRRLVEVAWVYVTDSLFSPKCLELRPQATAIGALYLADLSIRQGGGGGGGMEQYAGVLGSRSGWAVFDVSAQEVDEYCTDMLDMYARRKA